MYCLCGNMAAVYSQFKWKYHPHTRLYVVPQKPHFCNVFIQNVVWSPLVSDNRKYCSIMCELAQITTSIPAPSGQAMTSLPSVGSGSIPGRVHFHVDFFLFFFSMDTGTELWGVSSVSIRTLLTVLNYRTSNDPLYVRFEINILLWIYSPLY